VKQRLLFSWIGHSDLRAMAGSLPEPDCKTVFERIGGEALKPSDLGPTKTLLTTQTFDKILLLSNYPAEWNFWFAKWLKIEAETRCAVTSGPIRIG